MAYSAYPYQDSWSVAAAYQPSSVSSSTWVYDERTDDGRHALRRMQHGYSEETGYYTYDLGGVREDDPYRVQPRQKASRRTASGPSSHSRSGDESCRQTDRPRSSKMRESRGKGDSAGSSCSRSSTAHESSSKSKGSSHAAPPRAPRMERLATPELAPLSAGLRFCSCGCSDAYHEEESQYKQGRAKMDSQLQYAVRHIARH